MVRTSHIPIQFQNERRITRWRIASDVIESSSVKPRGTCTVLHGRSSWSQFTELESCPVTFHNHGDVDSDPVALDIIDGYVKQGWLKEFLRTSKHPAKPPPAEPQTNRWMRGWADVTPPASPRAPIVVKRFAAAAVKYHSSQNYKKERKISALKTK